MYLCMYVKKLYRCGLIMELFFFFCPLGKVDVKMYRLYIYNSNFLETERR